MSEALITRKGGFSHLSVEADHYNGSSTELVGFDFKNKSYFIRSCWKESGDNTLYTYDLVVERGGTISYTGQYPSSTFIENITIDVEAGTLYYKRKTAYLIYNTIYSLVVAMS